MREVTSTLQAVSGYDLAETPRGTDGCSIPTYAVPLRGLAHGFAKMATGNGLDPLRAKASQRLFDACMAEPFYVAGTGRACTALMQIAPGRIFAKTGAEGVFCAAIPEQGVAIAVKCDDGHTRAAEAMIAAALGRFFERDTAVRSALTDMASVRMHNWNGIHVGDIRATAALID
jgi:L-asparaginase II